MIRFVLSGSTKFWAQSTQWLRACLNLCAALPDALGTGAGAPAPGDAARATGWRLWWPACSPLEAMLRASGATAQEWLERREAWFTGLRGVEDFDLRVPPKALMSVEDAEAAVALAAAQAAEAIEWSTTDAALAGAAALSVARSARLLATLCSALSPDPERLTREQFLAATPPATHAATVTACAPGSVVALVRKGMKLTRERYLDTRVGFTPEGWMPLRELRPVERAVVRGVAYRAAVPAPPEWQGMGTPPCVWVLLELLDPAMIMPGRRKAARRPPAARGLSRRPSSPAARSPTTSSTGRSTPRAWTAPGPRVRASRCSSRTSPRAPTPPPTARCRRRPSRPRKRRRRSRSVRRPGFGRDGFGRQSGV